METKLFSLRILVHHLQILYLSRGGGGYFFPMYRLLQSVLYVFYFSFEIKHQKKRGFKTLDV